MTHAEEIGRLTVEQARAEYPVDLHGVVTYADVKLGHVFLQDRTGGAFVYFDPTGHETELTPGQTIEVTGATTPGDFSPCVKNGKYRITGRAPLPTPLRLPLSQLLSGRWVCYWTELSGTVESVTADSGSVQLNVRQDGGRFLLIMRQSSGSDPPPIGSKIRVQGALSALYNDRRQSLGIKIFAPGAWYVTTLKKPLNNAYDLPVLDLSRIGVYDATSDLDSQVHVRGAVIAIEPSGRIYLGGRDASIPLETVASCSPHPGDFIEAVGFRGFIEGRPGIIAAACRLDPSKAPPLRAAATTAEAILALQDEPAGDPTVFLHNSTKFDLRLVQIEGTLVKVSRSRREADFLMSSPHRDFVAHLTNLEAQPGFVAPEPGSLLRLTGLCLVTFDRYLRPVAFQIMLKDRTSIETIRRPAWWTPAHLAGLLSATAAMALAAIVWILSLRRRVNRQTGMIRGQLVRMEELTRRAEAASRAKGEFLANMSHEIRTPMNGVLGMIELALTGAGLNGEQRELMEIAKTSATTLLTVINDILDFSKIEAGKLELSPIPFALRDCIARTLKPLARSAGEKRLQLLCDIQADIPDGIVADPSRIAQILINLVGNALKFTTQGEIEVRVSADSIEDRRMRLHFTVRDTGIGIPLEKQRAIFEAFSQADGATTRVFGGTGLGLSISRRLVEIMNGGIWVESEPGKGSCFHFTIETLVAEKIERVEPRESSEPLQQSSRTRSPLSILLAEDNRVNREVARRLLERQGHAVTVVENGNEAVLAIERDQFDLVLMDMQMPEMDGLEAAAAIREREAGKSHVPIIALTAAAMSEDKHRCLEAGMDGYLTKPICVADLLREIDRLAVASGLVSCDTQLPLHSF